MFKDAITGKNSKLGEKVNKITIQTRNVSYQHYDREEDKNWETVGVEIVKQIDTTQEGLSIWNSWTDEQKQAFVEHGTALVKYGTRK